MVEFVIKIIFACIFIWQLQKYELSFTSTYNTLGEPRFQEVSQQSHLTLRVALRMANPHFLRALLIGTQIASTFGAMYEAYSIKPEGFVANTTSSALTDSGQMTHFMCSANAGKNGHTAFRISHDTGRCEMGNITANATQSLDGIKVYVESGVTVQSCAFSPTIATETHRYSRRYL